jgi:hypothetical protein
MKVFVSHQRADSAIATMVVAKLHQNQIDYYVDIVDSTLTKSGEQLGDYLRSEMGKCTQLIAVVSHNTKLSSWVPWEIGVATEKDFPLATYLEDNTPSPEFLRKWPYLRSPGDVDFYVQASKTADGTFRSRKMLSDEKSARRTATNEFFGIMRASLGQHV